MRAQGHQEIQLGNPLCQSILQESKQKRYRSRPGAIWDDDQDSLASQAVLHHCLLDDLANLRLVQAIACVYGA